MTKSLATLFSTLGHPFLLLPFVFSWLMVRSIGWEKAWPSVAAVLGSLVLMTVFLYFKKQKGEISNWDVSRRQERARNIYQPILLLIAVVAGVLYYLKQPFVYATLYFGLMMAVCYAINTRIKISQHTLIATYVGFLILPLSVWVGAGMLLFAVGVGWSRVVLGRHQNKEVLLGVAVGALFGAFQTIFIQ